MKNTILPLVFVFLAAELLRFVLPWWSVLPAGFMAGLIWANPGRTSLAAFAGAFLLWFFHAFMADQTNMGLLSGKIGILFKGLTSTHLLLITGFMGGLLAASGAWTGALLFRAVRMRQ